MPSKNMFLVAAAGSGKTDFLIKEALKIKNDPCLITTFTRANEQEIRDRLVKHTGSVPSNITVQTWFSLILQHGVKPYQGQLYDSKIRGMFLVNQQSARYSKEADVKKHYLDTTRKIYSDKMAKFAVRCNELSSGNLQSRIARIFRHVFVDEAQDIGGYDLEFLKLLLGSDAKTVLVGDPRQSTYTTNASAKNAKYKGAQFLNYFQDNKIEIEISENTLDTNFRCHSKICELANVVFPNLTPTKPITKSPTGHDGIFLVKKADLHAYLERHQPMQLRESKKTTVNENYHCMNFGESKGLTFERVLIYPSKPIAKWLSDPTVELAETTRSKLYVAITRAKYSTAFVLDYEDISEFKNFEA